MSAASAINPFAQLNGAAVTPATANDSASADRFLKLLVTQLQNQDPLNPMDNAQITTQMAQINTVSGIEKLNTTMQGLSGQFVQLQALTGASLVGNQVTLQGDRLTVADGLAVGGFELAGTAESVKIEVLSPAGRVVDTLDMGTQAAGTHAFRWSAADMPDGAGYRFRVVASAGTLAVASTPLMLDRVLSVSTSGAGLMLHTEMSGKVPYQDIKAFN